MVGTARNDSAKVTACLQSSCRAAHSQAHKSTAAPSLWGVSLWTQPSCHVGQMQKPRVGVTQSAELMAKVRHHHTLSIQSAGQGRTQACLTVCTLHHRYLHSTSARCLSSARSRHWAAAMRVSAATGVRCSRLVQLGCNLFLDHVTAPTAVGHHARRRPRTAHPLPVKHRTPGLGRQWRGTYQGVVVDRASNGRPWDEYRYGWCTPVGAASPLSCPHQCVWYMSRAMRDE